MEQRTFLGLDTTPRRELWAEIDNLNDELELEKGQCSELEVHNRHLRDRVMKLEEENRNLRRLVKDTKTEKEREIDAIIARYKPHRCKDGRFAKKKQ